MLLSKSLYFKFFLIANLFALNSVFSVLNYTMVVSTPGFTPLGVGKTTLPNFNNICGDQMVSSPIAIGFTFQYDGTGYTQFEVSENGQLFLGAPGISCNSNCGISCTYPNGIEPNNLSGGVDRPAICPLWDDHGFTVNGSQVNYQLTGVAPNRVMTAEWLLMDWKYNNTLTPHGGISFQVKLYESPAGQIDFIYRRDAQLLSTGTQSPSASIGLMGVAGDYYSTDNTGATISKVVQTNINTKPVNGVRYRWTQAGALPVELVSFEGKYFENKTVLQWQTATETNNNYFTVQRSTDALNFSDIETIKGKGNNKGYVNYNFTDYSIPESTSVFYYRLQQTDFDNKTAFSNIIEINTNSSADKAPEIYFNNEQGCLVITSQQNSGMRYVIDITDQLGRNVLRRDISFSKENNKISILIPLFLPGIYFARFSGYPGNFIPPYKFIKH